MDGYLPLGSAVKIKGLEGKFIIIGYKAYNKSLDLIKDYIVVQSPIGLITTEIMMEVDRDGIEEILCRGYEDETTKEFNDILVAKFDEKELSDSEIEKIAEQVLTFEGVGKEKEYEKEETEEEFDLF